MSSAWRVKLREVDAAAPGVAAFRRIVGNGGESAAQEGIWLDSSLQQSEHYGRTFSILCPADGPLNSLVRLWITDAPASDVAAGRSSFSSDATSWSITGNSPVAEHLRSCVNAPSSVFHVLRAGLELVGSGSGEAQGANPSGFNLGWIGAFGYELKHHCEVIRQSPTAVPRPHRSEYPDAMLMLADRAVITDHAESRSYILALTSNDPAHSEVAAQQREWMNWVETVIRELASAGSAEQPDAHASAAEATPSSSSAVYRFDHSREEYFECVRSAQASIAAGDTYELCLTTTAEGPALEDPFATYQQLRATSPVPYGAYINLAGTHVLSASPERFLKVTEEGTISAKPIKGTRGRSDDAVLDGAWRRDLETNSKDRAENLMIVDLLRNDLSVVAAPGSVRVPTLFGVESYSHVHQLVSTVEAQLAEGYSAVDVLAAAFPGGSMTGAPKVRTMELIEALERRARGLYSGCIGWMSFAGAADLSITIRTVVGNERASTFGVGGAIVADSTPEGEWDEVVVKSQALLQGLHATRQQR